eukprot:Pompholyxophrys_punicea_v1_NODE_7_length_8407_cov_7.217433.p2 type:complete len:147 gc:universal NODE_7_length_8407_cov_7.217433:3474-3034(-)
MEPRPSWFCLAQYSSKKSLYFRLTKKRSATMHQASRIRKLGGLVTCSAMGSFSLAFNSLNLFSNLVVHSATVTYLMSKSTTPFGRCSRSTSSWKKSTKLFAASSFRLRSSSCCSLKLTSTGFFKLLSTSLYNSANLMSKNFKYCFK